MVRVATRARSYAGYSENTRRVLSVGELKVITSAFVKTAANKRLGWRTPARSTKQQFPRYRECRLMAR